MALVTVQRSPSVTGSPQCSNSDGESDEDEGSKHEKSERFFAGKGTALVLALKDIPQYMERRLSTDSTRSTNSTQSNNSDIQQHLQSMFNLLKSEETLKMAVKLESQRPNRTRYLVIASRCCYRNGTSERRSKITRRNSAKSATITTFTANTVNVSGNSAGDGNGGVAPQRPLSVDSHKTAAATQQQSQTISAAGDTPVTQRLSAATSPNLCTNYQSIKCGGDKEHNALSDSKNQNVAIDESCLLGIDCNERTTIGLVVPILADTTIHLDGDGGFSVSVFGKTHIFKPVSVQAMWSALQTLHKVSHKARENNYYPGGPSHDWLSYYESRIESDQSCLNEWNAMDALESRRPPSPDAIRNKPRAKEETESVIKMKLKEIMMSVDLDEVTSKYIRGRLEEILDMDLGEYKSFIDAEMLIILGQMDAPTEIFEHVYLGSEWNASNLEELQRNGVRHILNVTREIDNFFPGMFDYFNVRVYDDEKTNLLKHWDNTYRYITRAKAQGSKVLVHCKMGVSRSASVVIAYAMKAYNWEFQRALQHVKERRNCIKPNKNFLNQLETYSGMLDAMKNKEKLQRSKSETNLKSTKDARLLPGSEPTPLIQALNQAKTKSVEEAVVRLDIDEADSNRITQRRSNAQKQRRITRRSSSTSPKTQTAIVMKQQSQSLENLTPERSVSDEPKNMRFPGSNGENYSVTQNQVLHIQKHMPDSSCNSSNSGSTSVRTRVHDLEAHNAARSSIHEAQREIVQNNLGSPVWTSSAKLITQTSNLGLMTQRDSTSSDVFSTQVDNVFAKEEHDKRHRRKTQSWTETSGPSGGIILDAVPTATILRSHTNRQRELPSRHASWGSGDTRCNLPLRNGSWNCYDSNRNTTTAIFEGQIQELKTNTLMSNKTVNENSNNTHLGTVKRTKQKLEESTVQKKLCQENGAEINATDTLKRNANLFRSVSAVCTTRARHPLRCNSEELVHKSSINLGNNSGSNQTQNCQQLPVVMRRSDGSRPFIAELYSASAPDSYTTSDIENRNAAAELETNVVLRNATHSADDQRISGNVQILKQNFEAKAVGVATTMATATLSTNTNITSATAAITQKKTHQSLPSSPVAQHVDHVTAHRMSAAETMHATATTTVTAMTTINAVTSASLTLSASSSCSTCSSVSCSSSAASSASEQCDHNVKGLVHKYQTTKTSTSTRDKAAAASAMLSIVANLVYTPATTNITNTGNTSNISSSARSTSNSNKCSAYYNFKPRPRSHYDRSFSATTTSMKTHDYSDSRPPPAPARISNISNVTTDLTQQHHQQQQKQQKQQHNQLQHQQQQQHQQLQHRRLAQHGKTHPLTRLSLPKQSFNAAPYNTM